jgi:hypothetical protein
MALAGTGKRMVSMRAACLRQGSSRM